jgi:hypothetical protein
MSEQNPLNLYLRRHPVQFSIILFVLTVIAVVVLLGQGGGSEILYKTF